MSHLSDSTRQAKLVFPTSGLQAFTLYVPAAGQGVPSGEQRDVTPPPRSFHAAGGACQTGSVSVT